MNNIIKQILLGLLLVVSLQSLAHYNSKGPYGGKVTCSLVADTNVYIGTENGGIFRSTSSKVIQWKPVPLGLASGKITSLAYANGIVYAGTADSGIYISNNAGTKWAAANTGITNKKISSLGIKGNTVFAGTYGGGIFASTTGGSSWNNVRSGLIISSLGSNENMLLAATDQGILKSIDGLNWYFGDKSLSMSDVTSFTFTATQVFAGTKSKGVFASALDSLDWKSFNNGLTGQEVNSLLFKNNLLLVATNSGLFTSPETSAAWERKDTGIKTQKISAVSWYTKFIAGTKDGIYVSTSPENSWTELNPGFNNLATYATLAIDTNIIIAATEKGVYVSKNIATSYTKSNKGLLDSLNVSSLVFADGKIYAGTLNKGIFISADTGKNWSAANSGLFTSGIHKLLVSGSSIYAAGADSAIYFSSRATISWIKTTGIKGAITGIASDNKGVYASDNLGNVYVKDNNWIISSPAFPGGKINSMVVNKEHLFVSAENSGIYKINTSWLEPWGKVTGPLPGNVAYSLESYYDILFSGIRSGLYYSINGGDKWEPAGTQDNYPTFAEVKNISFVNNGKQTIGRIFVSTPYNSLYSNSLAEIPVVLGIKKQADILSTSVFNIFPNPNSGIFKLSFTENVEELSILNQEGRQIGTLSTLTDQTVNVNLPSGLYFLRAHTLNGVVMKKLIIK